MLLSHPENTALLSIAASACYALGDYEAAAEYLEQAIRLRPDSATLRENLERVRRKMRGGGPER